MLLLMKRRLMVTLIPVLETIFGIDAFEVGSWMRMQQYFVITMVLGTLNYQLVNLNEVVV